MKIAVPYEEGNICPRMGMAMQALICEVEDGKIVSSEVISTKGHGHAKLPAFLKENGAEIMLGDVLGMPMLNAIEKEGLGLVAGAKGDAIAAVEAYLAGELKHDPSAIDRG